MPDRFAFCNEPGCSGIAKNSRFCEKHQQNNYAKRKAAARPERDSWYWRAAWRTYVQPYKLRTDPMCFDCGATATEVHHIDSSWKETGDWRLFIDQNNLMSLCHGCHSKRTMAESRKEGKI